MHRHGESIFQGCIRISMNEFFSNMTLNYLYRVIVLPIFFILLRNYNSLMKNYVLALVFIDNTYFGLELDFCYNFTQTLVWNCIFFCVYFYRNSKKWFTWHTPNFARGDAYKGYKYVYSCVYLVISYSVNVFQLC